MVKVVIVEFLLSLCVCVDSQWQSNIDIRHALMECMLVDKFRLPGLKKTNVQLMDGWISGLSKLTRIGAEAKYFDVHQQKHLRVEIGFQRLEVSFERFSFFNCTEKTGVVPGKGGNRLNFRLCPNSITCYLNVAKIGRRKMVHDFHPVASEPEQFVYKGEVIGTMGKKLKRQLVKLARPMVESFMRRRFATIVKKILLKNLNVIVSSSRSSRHKKPKRVKEEDASHDSDIAVDDKKETEFRLPVQELKLPVQEEEEVDENLPDMQVRPDLEEEVEPSIRQYPRVMEVQEDLEDSEESILPRFPRFSRIRRQPPVRRHLKDRQYPGDSPDQEDVRGSGYTRYRRRSLYPRVGRYAVDERVKEEARESGKSIEWENPRYPRYGRVGRYSGDQRIEKDSGELRDQISPRYPRYSRYRRYPRVGRHAGDQRTQEDKPELEERRDPIDSVYPRYSRFTRYPRYQRRPEHLADLDMRDPIDLANYRNKRNRRRFRRRRESEV